MKIEIEKKTYTKTFYSSYLSEHQMFKLERIGFNRTIARLQKYLKEKSQGPMKRELTQGTDEDGIIMETNQMKSQRMKTKLIKFKFQVHNFIDSTNSEKIMRNTIATLEIQYYGNNK